MKKLFMLSIAIVMMASFSIRLVAQETNDVAAKILQAMTITATAGLHFGTMTVPVAADSVIVTPLNIRSNPGGHLTLLNQIPVSSAAAYDITGDNNATYQIFLPDNLTVTVISGGNHMDVVDFTCSYAGLTSTLSGTGTDAFTVGAKLKLDNGQPAGLYEGEFDVNVIYN
jgi:hypothetical protein